MEKIFDVTGVPNVTLIFRGMALTPRKNVHLTMTEKELNDFKAYFDVLEFAERKDDSQLENIIVTDDTVVAQKSEPIIEEQLQEQENVVVIEEEIKKETSENDRFSNRSDKGKSKKQTHISRRQ